MSSEIIEQGFKRGEKLAEEVSKDLSKHAGALGTVFKGFGVAATLYEGGHSLGNIFSGDATFKDAGNVIIAGATIAAFYFGGAEIYVTYASIAWGVSKMFME